MSSPDFTRVYDEHVWRVYGFFGYRVGSRAEAEDLTQLTFERALRAWGRFDPRRGPAQAWLMAIARNLLVDHHRRPTGREISLDEEGVRRRAEQVPGTGPEPDLGVSAELESALDDLGERERELIALRYGGDLTGPEIAELTGLSLANVQQILSRSLRRMRTALERDPAATAVSA